MTLYMFLSPQITHALLIAPIIIVLVGVIKRLGMESKLAPLASLFIGIVLAFIFGDHPLVGILAGLAVSGLYCGIKTVSEP